MNFEFKVLHQDTKTRARVGEIQTSHGVIQTPAFVPVGTQATVKSLTPEELHDLGVDLFFVNTYHAYLRPGIEVIQKFGGLHRFMNWNKPLITDSGGFQVFSLGNKKFLKNPNSSLASLKIRGGQEELQTFNKFSGDERSSGQLVNIDENGVTFTSHWDGTKHRFTPEVSIDIQHKLGADLIIAFDECTPYPATLRYAKAALDRTHRWAKRSLKKHQELKISPQALYGVVQGSVFPNLRKESADFISHLDFDGIAIGGVSVGESKDQMQQVCDWVIPRLPAGKPRHLLGVGEIDDIFAIIERGVDTFDCVQPTRLARMGLLFGSKYKVKSSKFTFDITKKIYSEDKASLEPRCSCYTCKNFSRAYIHHLFRVRELLAYRLATIHNLHFVTSLVEQIRKHIIEGTFLQFKQEFFRISNR